MATHYYPGLSITLAPDVGWQHTWSNDFVKDLPKPPGEQDNPYAYPGDDRHRPATAGGTLGGYNVLFTITGEGRWVDLWATGSGAQGVLVTVFQQTGVADDVYTVEYTGEVIHRDTWTQTLTRFVPGPLAYYSARNRPATTGIRLLLQPGLRYFFEVGSLTYNNALDYPGHTGYGFDQTFTLQARYTPVPLPDSIATAQTIAIPASGGSYSSDTIMNDLLSANPVPSYAEGGLYRAAYWTFTPLTYSQLTASFTVLPAELLGYIPAGGLALQMWEMLPGGTVARLGRAEAFTSNQVSPVITYVESGHTYLFAIGWFSASSADLDGGRQKYQIQVAAVPAQEPPPDPDPGTDPGTGQDHPLLSTFADSFTGAALDTTRWGSDGAGTPGSSGYALTGGSLRSNTYHYAFDSAYVHFSPVAGQTFNGSFLVTGNAGSPPCSAGFTILYADFGTSISAAFSSDDGSAEWTPTVAYDPAVHAWLRVRTEARQDSGDWYVTYICETAPALGQWTTMLRSPEVISPSFGDGVGVSFTANYGTVVLASFNGAAAAGGSVLAMKMPDGTYRTVGLAGQPLSLKMADGTYRTWPGSTVPLYQRQQDGTWREVITP